jgi:hypothetical protein
MSVNAFNELFKILQDADLFGVAPAPLVDLDDEEDLRNAIDLGASRIPGLYHDTYVAPLLRNLKWVMGRVSEPTLETLSAAVYDHHARYKNTRKGVEIKRSLRSFLAVTSNLYRSFLEPEPTAKFPVPKPGSIPPPLATFRPKLNLERKEFGPFSLPLDEVERLCGARVAVISLPSCYRNHVALCWAAIAHEAGGHGILHAYPGLLLELQRKVRRLFYQGQDPRGQTPENAEQFLGLLWQYWTEEAASDVCAVLNLGPIYGKGLAVFLSAFGERLDRHFGAPEGKYPRLSHSWPPPNTQITRVDSHPTDILKLHVIIGAIECLPLNDLTKQSYIYEIKQMIDYSLEMERINNPGNDNKMVSISGWFSYKPGKILRSVHSLQIERTVMEEHARRVGRLVASESMDSLNGNDLQDLETWDNADEALAQSINRLLNFSSLKNPNQEFLGDDAQLLAGTVLALFENPNPDFYYLINEWLNNELQNSWTYDPIWGEPLWYPLAGPPRRPFEVA